MFRVDRIEVRGIMLGEQLQLGMGELRTEWAMQILVKQGKLSVISNEIGHIARTKKTTEFKILQGQDVADASSRDGSVLNEEQLLFIAGGQTNTFDDDVDEASVQDLALNEDNIFQADQCDAFYSDVDEAPTAQTMFMENLSSADPIYDEAGLSYDSDILYVVQDHDNYVDSVGEYHEVHEMQNDVQPNYFVDSDAEYTSDSNIIPYEQDTLEIAKKNRIRMFEKMKITLWVDSKIKIAPPDYSKENYLATLTPQRQLTPEQIFWFLEIEDLTPKPMSKMTVYLPDTPAKLVPRVLLTKSQVKINIHTLI
uniref:Retrovirus-related Pol polyprotein from transposon TNT 1-94 n=1 Tax=Tanacetum cinerariifolium TaxID=118510 RepID=A0A6L2KLS7_TANCI|nr:retrovirus-related Pol polyprotein from transposon TNT 1-94 [Tanacetum cinerariifolium]